MRQVFVCLFMIFNPALIMADFEIAIPTNPSLAPSFEGATPAESHLKHHELNALAHAKMNEKSGAGHLVTTSAASRPQIKVSSSEHLISDADKIVRNPQETIGLSLGEEVEDSEAVEHNLTCEEAAEPTEIQLERRLAYVKGIQVKAVYKHTQKIVKIATETQSIRTEIEDIPSLPGTISVTKSSSWKRKGSHCSSSWTETHISNPVYEIFKRKAKIDPLSQEVIALSDWDRQPDTIIETTPTFPTRAREHVSFQSILSAEDDEFEGFEAGGGISEMDCEYESMRCVQGPTTLHLQGHAVTRDCLKYQMKYHCQSQRTCTCLTIRSNPSCHQVGSECMQKVQGRCLLYKQTFRCHKLKLKPQRVHTRGLPCMDGSCGKMASWEVNQDLPEVISKLSVFSEMRKDMDATTGQVFSGQTLKCNRECAGFKDCCKRFGGWGVDTGLASCNEEERLLSDLRNKRRCVFTGSFCAEKVLGVCIRKKLSFCCYASPLARIIHEQGRAQLGIGWGSAEHPNCRALTVEELTRIQFDRLNLSEITADLVSKINVPDIGKVTERFADDWRERLPNTTDTGRPLDGATPMQEVLKSRQDSIRAGLGEYSLNQDGSKGGTDAELVF